MNLPNFKRQAVAMACMLFAASSHAELTVLESVLVTGSSEPSESIAKPFSVLSAPQLNADGASTLGEALRYQPGLSATGFGPNSSRPIVRGQDADRIKILRNSAALVDVSALSFDHALPVDLFSLHQVEIIRGPAALAYGGNAVGGAINLVDQRIARTPVQGVQSEFNLLTGGASDQNAVGFKLDSGIGQGISLHLDGFRRHENDLKTPTFTDPTGFTGTQVRNSSSKSDGAAIAVSKQLGEGYLGLSAEQSDKLYGVPKKLDVQIGLQNERYALEGEQAFPSAAIRQVKYRLGKTDYQHQEFEAGKPATRFLNDGLDGRIELGVNAFNLAGFKVSSTVGGQFENTDFSAIGEEAFVPSTQTRQAGLFALFSASPGGKGSGTLEFGLRADQVDVNAASSGESPFNGPVAGTGVSSGPAVNRSFSPQSVSLGYSKPLGQEWLLGGSISRVERAPSGFELYADGLHVATDAYEKGNPDLQVERGRHLEVNTTWTRAQSRFNANAFVSSYSNYISLIGRTGANSRFDEDGDPSTADDLVPVFDFKAVPARFHGLELSYQTTYALWGGTFTPSLQYDLVRGKRSDGAGNLPRISPQRWVAKADWTKAGWTLSPELIVLDDSKASEGDPAVPGYYLVNLRLGKRFSLNRLGGEVFGSLQSLTDELAFSATTLNTVRQFTPLPGRSALLGLRLAF